MPDRQETFGSKWTFSDMMPGDQDLSSRLGPTRCRALRVCPRESQRPRQRTETQQNRRQVQQVSRQQQGRQKS